MTKRPRTILYIDVTGKGGGSNASLRVLLAALDRQRFNPIIAFGDRGNRENWQPEVVHEFPLAGLHNYDFFPAGWTLRWIYHLLKFALHFPIDFLWTTLLIRGTRPSAVHINGGQLLTCGLAARLSGSPVIWHVRELVARNCVGRVQDSLYAWCSKRIVAVSRAVAERIPVSGSRTAVIFNAVAPAAVTASEVAAFRREFGIDEGEFVVTLLAHRITVGKGYLFLADVAEALRDITGMKFVLAGEFGDRISSPMKKTLSRIYEQWGEEDHDASIRDRWRRLVSDHRADFVGTIRGDVGIAASDLVVCPNHIAEPFGRSVIEANIQAKPVLASNLPAFTELIEDGVTGWLLPTIVPQWVDRIMALYKDRELLLRVGKEAQRRAGRFLASHHADQIMGLYDEILGP